MAISVMGSSMARRAALWGCSALALSTAATSAIAQDAGSGIVDIIVTAQKREQNLQDVPVAVTAISADALKVNYGVGARFHTPAATALRLDLARGSEGWRFVFSASAPF